MDFPSPQWTGSSNQGSTIRFSRVDRYVLVSERPGLRFTRNRLITHLWDVVSGVIRHVPYLGGLLTVYYVLMCSHVVKILSQDFVIVLHHGVFGCIRKALPEVGPIVSLTVISYGWTASVVLLPIRILFASPLSGKSHSASNGGAYVFAQPLLRAYRLT